MESILLPGLILRGYFIFFFFFAFFDLLRRQGEGFEAGFSLKTGERASRPYKMTARLVPANYIPGMRRWALTGRWK